MRKFHEMVRQSIALYRDCQVPRAAAALSHYLTLSIFPTILCLYVMLGKWFPRADSIPFLQHLLPESTIDTFLSYLAYVAANDGTAMLFAGISLMVTTSAAAFRSLYGTLASVHGVRRRRFRGGFPLVISFFVSPVVFGVVYFAALMTAGHDWLVETMTKLFGMQQFWLRLASLRFLLMLGILPLLLAGLYRLTAPRRDQYSIWPGTVGVSVALVVVSYGFSRIIYASSKYPLVYGSLASIMILMVWLQICSNIVICGALLNQLIYDKRKIQIIKKGDDRDAGC
ncbi:MAG: YihY/virulence factor BrkB family protein [Oscillospiraceae bacterium]